MKTNNVLFSLIVFSSIALSIDAQSIPNGNFESWTVLSFEQPKNYLWSTNTEAFRKGLSFNVTKSTDAYHGNFAAKMTTVISSTDTMPGIFLNVNPKNGDPATWNGGFPYSEKPIGIRGYYKCAIASPDTGFIMVFCYKGGVNIGQYGMWFNGTKNTYTLFSVTFNPPLAQTPDTIIIGAGSSNWQYPSNMRNGSMLLLDSISFTGVPSQPLLFNGSFELWQSSNIDLPNNWYLDGGGNSLTGGALKTTDAKLGNAAIELVSFVGDRKNIPATNSGQISTGWYPRNCSGSCLQQGGYPFANQMDTLAFWYKYSPVGVTNGKVNMIFKKNGNQFGNTTASLNTSANYQYKEIPFNLSQIPDSVILSFQSSDWTDSLLTFVGSNLKIDEVHFKSQPLKTGISKYGNLGAIQIYPNPSSDYIRIALNDNFGKQTEMILTSTTGQQVFTQRFSDWTGTTIINVSQFPEGIYFLHVVTADKTIYDKKISIVIK